MTPALKDQGLANSQCFLVKRGFTRRASEGFKIAPVGSLADLGSSPQVGNAKAQRAPLEHLLRIFLAGPIDLELAWVINGGLYTQNQALLVIELNGVGVDAMADTNPFGSLFEGTGYLTLTSSWPALAKEAQHVGASKTTNPMM